MLDFSRLAGGAETQFYLAHLFLLLVTMGAYALPRGRLPARFAWLLAMGALGASILVRSLAAGRLPMANMYEFGLMMDLVLCALVIVADLRLDARLPALALAAACFVLASVQLLFFQESRPLMPALKSWWLVAHVMTAVVAYGLLAGSCALALVGLFRGDDGRALAAMVKRLVFLAFPFLTLLIITGAIWAEYAWGSFWRWDPKETWALVTWLAYLGYLHMVTARRWTGRRALWLALAGFAVVVFSFYGVNLLLSGLHSYA